MSESGWMIEAMTTTGPQWWTGRALTVESFSNDPNEGVRFVRQQDAEAVRCRLFQGAVYAFTRSAE